MAGAKVGVRVTVEVGGATVGVRVGPVAVGVRVGVGSGGASRRISNERTEDQALFIPPAVRARTRHQKRRSLVKVWLVWVWVSPVLERTSGELNELESSIWIWYVAAPATGFHEKVILWFKGNIALFAGLTNVGAAGGPGGGAFVVLIRMCSAGNAPLTCRAMSGLPSLLKSPATIR